MGTIIKIITIGLLLHIGINDYRIRRISNINCFLVFLIGVIELLFLDGVLFDVYVAVLAVFSPIFIVFVLSRKKIGAGDVKLIFGLCFLLGMERLIVSLLMAMMLAIITFFCAKISRKRFYNSMKERGIPLGFFISIGVIWVLLLS